MRALPHPFSAFPRRLRLVAWLAGFLLALPSAAAWAHVGEAHADEASWNQWTLTPGIIIPTALVVLVYVVGIVRRRALDDQIRLWRHVAFLSGVAAVFVAVASPLDYVAEHLFSVHQIQHLLLRMIAPMLIALAAPQAMLISGLPSGLRRSGLAPLLGNRVLQRIFAFLINPVVVTVLFVAALYVWQYPPYHDAALLNETIHDTMHLTMLAAGLLFWWRMFDVRPAPLGLSYGVRLMVLWIVALTNIGLGAYTTLKSELLYPAYDVVGRLFDLSPLTDETVGGFIIWVPSTMMCLVAVIIVIHFWGRHETRLEERRAGWLSSGAPILAVPTTGEALVAQAQSKNRALAVGVFAFVIAVFATAIFIGVLSHLNGERPHGLFAHVSAGLNKSTR
jgi:putative membrane protein